MPPRILPSFVADTCHGRFRDFRRIGQRGFAAGGRFAYACKDFLYECPLGKNRRTDAFDVGKQGRACHYRVFQGTEPLDEFLGERFCIPAGDHQSQSEFENLVVGKAAAVPRQLFLEALAVAEIMGLLGFLHIGGVKFLGII